MVFHSVIGAEVEFFGNSGGQHMLLWRLACNGRLLVGLSEGRGAGSGKDSYQQEVAYSLPASAAL